MAMNLASHVAEKIMGDVPTATTQDNTVAPTGEKMKALVWHGKHDVRVELVDKPQIVESKDVLLAVTGTTVCGSDLHLYNAEMLQMKAGDILGHEFCGVIEKVGPDVKKFKVGQRVVASFQIACGECEYCKRGLSSMCDNTNKSSVMNAMYGHRFAGLFGYSHFAGGFAGGQAEYVRVPFADTNLLPIPDGVPDERALYLSDIVSTSYHACKRAHIKEGDTVGIWGLGPIGLHCAQWCKLMGAGRIIGIDNVPERLAMAQKRFGVEPLNFDDEATSDVVAAIQKMAPGGLDRSIDCAAFRYAKGMLHKVERALNLETDTSEIVNEQIKCVKKFGRIVLIADYAGFTNHFNIGAVMEKGIALIGGGQAPVQKYWEMLMRDYIVTNKFDPTVILSHRFAIDEFADIYQAFDEKKAGILKVFVETKHSFAPAPGTPALTTVNKAVSEASH
jgi:threonine dehydrogenase-like Zn-dependent dehydrogenase